tara:strand:+ start:605 stop:1174 length:570 start_codon:yes stop_codon:yes gene_type:complete
MIRIGILGDIGSGKSYVANSFGYPVFNADLEVSRLYKKNKKVFKKLKKILPKYISSFPINKNEISKAILINKINLKKIITIVHLEIRKSLNLFLKKNRNKKIIILDIPLLLENKIHNKNDILVFVDSKKTEINKRLKKRPNFNNKLINKFKKIQLSSSYKKKKSHFIIKNNFTKKSVKKDIKYILNKIL